MQVGHTEWDVQEEKAITGGQRSTAQQGEEHCSERHNSHGAVRREEVGFAPEQCHRCVCPLSCCACSETSLAPTVVVTTQRNRWLRRVEGGGGVGERKMQGGCSVGQKVCLASPFAEQVSSH